ncbi:acrylate utilization transcriptional regulator AcuR [Tropicimonas aquimaris]|uniref:TetR/AcrR family transcriptional regulator n=1 Tax=Tropicimonas aquimaris TaxID=914152 RepID=A0ABW3ITZ9_9RHOB
MDSHAARSAADSPPRRGRPKRDPATSEVRQRLIRTGLAHLTERGYSAVGLDEILKAASVPKGSFYHYFRNKAEFGAALIDAYNTYFCELLDRALLDERMTPLDRLRAFAAEAERGMARHGFRRGCLVGNLGQEMGALPEEFRDRLVSVLEEWQRRTERCLQLAQQAGEIGPAQDPEALAAFFWIGWEGAVLRAKLERRAEPLQRFADSFFTSITP